RNRAVGEHLERVAGRGLLILRVQLRLAPAAEAREKARRDEERQQRDGEGEAAESEDEEADDERREGAGEREQPQNAGDPGDRSGEQRGINEMCRRQIRQARSFERRPYLRDMYGLP